MAHTTPIKCNPCSNFHFLFHYPYRTQYINPKLIIKELIWEFPKIPLLRENTILVEVRNSRFGLESVKHRSSERRIPTWKCNSRLSAAWQRRSNRAPQNNRPQNSPPPPITNEYIHPTLINILFRVRLLGR